MRHSAFPFVAAVSLLALALPADARPRFGGTLRVQMQAAPRSLDPAESASDGDTAARERILRAVFEPLVRVSPQGRLRPGLATSWSSRQAGRRWTFRLRRGVKLHDGTLLTPAAAAAALSAVEPGWTVTPGQDAVLIDAERSAPDLPQRLSDPRYHIAIRAADGALQGTGPFAIQQFEPGRRVVLRFHAEHWEGRPFLDQVQIELGRSAQQQMVQLELGRVDLAELPPAEARRPAKARIWSSEPVALLTLALQPDSAALQDARLREALGLSIDRAAIHAVLLQKQGEPAGSLLPDWLSGYGFLFPASRDVARARQLAAAQPASAPPLTIGYDAADPLARVLAERVALNARDAGLRVHTAAAGAKPDLRVTRLRLRARTAAAALTALAAALPGQDPNTNGPETRYGLEKSLLESGWLAPLAHLPEVYGSAPNLRSWNTPGLLRCGEWVWEDLWLAGDRP